METDWKKKYEEVLDLAKSYYGKSQNEFLDTLFPELRESEDERIRKEMIDFLKSEKAFQTIDLPISERWIAWLEKQKEQIEEDLSTRLNGVMQEYVKSGKDEEEQEHRLKCYQLFWDALGDSEFFKQKEQKPAEWSDTDNIGWDEALACVTRAEKAAKNEEELQNAVTAEKWLKEIKFKYYVHPVTQEWGDEDEEMFDAVIDIISNSLYEPLCPRDGMLAWFSSLKNRGNFLKRNSNSPSWSEEDEKILRGIEQCVYDNVSNIGTVSKVRYIDWLKSIKNRGNFPKSNTNSSIKGGQR